MEPTSLVPFAEEHVPAFAAILDDPSLLHHTRIPEPLPADFPQQFYVRGRVAEEEGTRANFAVVQPDGTMVGFAMAVGIDETARTAELGYAVASFARGQGIGTRTLEQLTEWAFTVRDLFRLELHIGAANEASKVVAARAGYVHEGTLRCAYVKGARWEDTEIWSRLATDR